MNAEIFREFQTLIYKKSGIALKEGKEALVAARIGRRLADLGLHDHRAYLDYLSEDSSGEELVHLLDAISTNVTQFFREGEHFDFLERALLRWASEGQKRFRIWSAACSTGEEPYTIGMVCSSVLDTARSDVRILGTDISTKVLARAKEGKYSIAGLDNIPEAFHSPVYVAKLAGSEQFMVHERIRRLVTFGRINLAAPPFPMSGPFDVVFCRNVMIYFDNEVRERLLREIHRLLRPGGYLLVGHSETLAGLNVDFEALKPSIYRK